MNKRFYTTASKILFFMFLLYISGCAARVEKKPEEKPIKKPLVESLNDFLTVNKNNKKLPVFISPNLKVDSFKIDNINKSIEITFNKDLSYNAFRDANVEYFYSSIKEMLDEDFKDYKLILRSLNKPIEELIPNFYRLDSTSIDHSRLARPNVKRPLPIVQNISRHVKYDKGLFNRNIALWHSHGWYFDSGNNRWEWQRPRLFQTVEDLLPMSFTLPYIIPMLENAGANVFVPRERDTQINEVIIDNDNKASLNKNYIERSFTSNNEWKTGVGAGFLYGIPPYPENYNPFLNGTTRFVLSNTEKTAEAEWIAEIPEEGYYSVYISFSSSEYNAEDVLYSVYHKGGQTDFIVNQKIGGNTWIYLGNFKFDKGFSPATSKVVLINKSKEKGKIISADAVRFGGGVGIVMRNSSTSGRPKFVEGSRYYLQFLGMPDTLVYNLNDGISDYKDDYQSRGEYVNYLMGSPFGPNRDRNNKGLGIPIDLSLAFHTDAGITKNDTTVGTLAIYSIEDADSNYIFPDSVSRFANRDLADIMQTQIVEDLRAKYDPIWNRRQLREAQYSEALRPNVPSVLLELLSHQNFLDMQFILDPRFRFDVSRSIYKSMLKFIAAQNRIRYVVQPLPVDHFQAILDQNGKVTLKWQPVTDKLEPSAVPESYVVHTRKNDSDFDNGRTAFTNQIEFDLEPGVIYSYKVAAVNSGGESFPSEILSVCWIKNGKDPVLIVNGFDRICGPAAIKSPVFSGFANFIDAGVPDKYDFGFTGTQYNFDPASEYKSNEAPGHGASHADYETKIIAGNTFDFPYIHGQSIMNLGYSFSSASDEAVWDKQIDLSKYKFIDLILGEEKETNWQKSFADSIYGTQFKTFPSALKEVITDYCKTGGNLFISGSYVGSDLFNKKEIDSLDIQFAKQILKFNWISDHASATGKLATVSNSFFKNPINIEFNTELNDKIYAVEAPDAIGPFGGSKTILRYNDNKFSAATAYKKEYGVVVFGFPFETIKHEKVRNSIIRSVFDYFKML